MNLPGKKEKTMTTAKDTQEPKTPGQVPPVVLRLHAYYFSFEPTGVPQIDKILSAVACAGKAFHHTECWSDECSYLPDPHKGISPVDWIQNAANEAAEDFGRLEAGASE